MELIELIIEELSDFDKVKLLRVCKYFLNFEFKLTKLTDVNSCAKSSHTFTNILIK